MLAVLLPAQASAAPKLAAAEYPGMSTFSCRTDAIPIHPGQNLNDFGVTSTCPNARKLSGPGSVADFASGSKS